MEPEPKGGWLGHWEFEAKKQGGGIEEDKEEGEVVIDVEEPSPIETQCAPPDLESDVALWPRAMATRQMQEPRVAG